MRDPRIRGGMEKQFRLRQARLNSGEKPIGWKVGFGAPASLQRLQLEVPLIGFLNDKVLVQPGATIPIEGWMKPALEPEIAVYLGKDLRGPVDRESARAAITSIGPAIELADIYFAPHDVERILAENIYNRHVILGQADPSRLGCRLEGLEALVSRNGTEVARTTDLQAMTGDLIDIVCHVANSLSLHGEKLRAQEFIITGSIIPPVWVEAEDKVKYTLAPIDTLEITVS